MPASSRSSSLSSSLGTSLSSSRAPSAGALWSRPPPEEVHYVAVSAGGPRCNKLRKFTPKAPKERKLPPMSAADLAQEISVGLRHASRRTQHEGAYSSASGGDAEAARRPARSLRDGLPELWPPLAASGSLPMMAHGPAHKRVDAPELNLASEYGRSYATPRPTKQWGVGMATEYWTRNDGCIYKSSPMVCRDGYFDAIT